MPRLPRVGSNPRLMGSNRKGGGGGGQECHLRNTAGRQAILRRSAQRGLVRRGHGQHAGAQASQGGVKANYAWPKDGRWAHQPVPSCMVRLMLAARGIPSSSHEHPAPGTGPILWVMVRNLNRRAKDLHLAVACLFMAHMLGPWCPIRSRGQEVVISQKHVCAGPKL